MKIDYDMMKGYAPAIVRIGMSIVFLWFGIMQILNPVIFIPWLPQEVSIIALQPATFVMINGIFETIFGSLLLIGVFTRLSSLLLGLHLSMITISIGFTEIGIRDLGLSLAALSIFFNGPDKLCLEGSSSKDKIR